MIGFVRVYDVIYDKKIMIMMEDLSWNVECFLWRYLSFVFVCLFVCFIGQHKKFKRS